jgi:hypothetical protein
LFSGLPDHVLADMMQNANDLVVQKDEHIRDITDRRACVAYIITGHIRLIRNRQTKKAYKTKDSFFMDPGLIEGEETHLSAIDRTWMMLLDMDRIIQLVRDYPEFTRKFLEWYVKE